MVMPCISSDEPLAQNQPEVAPVLPDTLVEKDNFKWITDKTDVLDVSPAHSVHNQESKWPNLKNFFSSLGSTLLVKIFGLYTPGVLNTPPADKSTYLFPKNQNKQKWWENQDWDVRVVKSDQFLLSKNFSPIAPFAYHENNSYQLLGNEDTDNLY